jgi:hypothetical protein
MFDRTGREIAEDRLYCIILPALMEMRVSIGGDRRSVHDHLKAILELGE